MSSEFKIGDEVYLKSGGERMTVEEVDGESISYVWFDRSKAPTRDTFPAGTLRKAPTPEEREANLRKMASRLAGRS